MRRILNHVTTWADTLPALHAAAERGDVRARRLLEAVLTGYAVADAYDAGPAWSSDDG